MEGYYSVEELKDFGFKEIGERVLISKKASIYTPSRIAIGHDVRIDDFCFLVGNITIGSYIHLAPYVSIHGTGNGSVTMKDFSALSSYTTVYASSDDYSGNSITNPTVGEKYERLISSDIVIEKHAIVGLHSVILPNAYLAEGVALGAMSMLSKPTEPWGIYVGIPCKRVKERLKDCLEMEAEICKNERTLDLEQ